MNKLRRQNNALINTDEEDYLRVLKARQQKKVEKSQAQEIGYLKDQIALLWAEIRELKNGNSTNTPL